MLDQADPQDLNPYAYAGDNPSTSSDPSGQYRLCLGGCDLPPIPAVTSHNGGGSSGGGSGGGYYPPASDPFPQDPALGNPAIYGSAVWGPAVTARPVLPPRPRPVVAHSVTTGTSAGAAENCGGSWKAYWQGVCQGEIASDNTLLAREAPISRWQAIFLIGSLFLPIVGAFADAGEGAAVAGDTAEDTGSDAARFITNSSGDSLDTSRVTIPEGKFDYLLKNPSKAGVFNDSLGFDQNSLDSALQSHLVENFGNATESVPMTGGGTKFSVTGPMVGPSSAGWNITSVWGIDPDGLTRLITATP